jgi:CheY-like chemotaxis protein
MDCFDGGLPHQNMNGERLCSMAKQKSSALKPQGRVFIIDDEPEICRFAANLVKELGFEAITASDAASVYLHELKNSDIIFIDIVMPGMDGMQILEVLSRRNAKCGIVLMSNSHDEQATAEAMAKERGLRLIGVLHKPIRLLDVQSLLQYI